MNTHNIRIALYEGEGEGDGGAAGSGDQGAAGGSGGETKFTQEHVNSLLAKEKKQWQDRVKKAETTLTEALKAKGLTEKQRADLQAELETLQASMRSKEEQIEHERQQAARQYKEEKDALTAEANDWKNRYTTSTIQRAILDGAIEHEAYDPEQLCALLAPNTSLHDDVDEAGKKTGRLVPKTTLDLPDSENKMVKVTLSPREVIDKMKKFPKKYGNLFRNTATGGIGANPNAGSGNDQSDLVTLARDPVKYREARRKGNIPGVKPTGQI